MKCDHLCLILAIGVAFTSSGAAQGPPQPPSVARESTVIHVRSDLVLIPVHVRDGRDSSVSGLSRSNFKVFDDNVEQVISHFAVEDAPVSVGIVFDASASMRGKLQKSREAVARLLATANPEDEFFLVQFNRSAELVLGFTNDTQAVQEQTSWITPKGPTALLDAIHFSIGVMKGARHPRRALILISDGEDNCSRYDFGEVRNTLRETDVQLFAMAILDPLTSRLNRPEPLFGGALLSELVDQTGGATFDIFNLKDLPNSAAKIGLALRNQYVIGYAPAASRGDGKYHRVQVKVIKPRGFPRLRISWKRGYYALLE